MNISYHTPPNKDILDGAEVRVLDLIQHLYIIEFYVQVLVNGLEGAADRDVILELDCYGRVGEGAEEGEE